MHSVINIATSLKYLDINDIVYPNKDCHLWNENLAYDHDDKTKYEKS